MTNDENVAVVRNYKDTVFRMLFKEPENLLSLYNAVNQTHYTDVSDLEIVTLENAVYLSMKNDVACVLDMKLQLFEQQSTYNPNMPLRCLMYVSTLFEKLTLGKDIYRSKPILIPTPRFFVFYNGTEKLPERTILRLSDLFMIKEEKPSLELEVIHLNINDGLNNELKNTCPLLLEYMQYVDIVRRYLKDYKLTQAVPMAIEECIKNNILRDFLLENKAEVTKMTIFEYDEELHNKTLLEDGYEVGYNRGSEEGRKEGRKEGHEEGRNEMIRNMHDNGMSAETIANIAKVSVEDVNSILSSEF